MASSMICGAALLGLSATQAAAQAPPAAGEVSEIVVTGSRIPQANLTGISPVTVVTNQELKLQGTTNVETLLNSLPQVFADFGGGVSNGATGTATVNLRGLGSARTLVLVDGRRLMPGDPALPVADLNNIPAALVDRVDVLTGGASAVYGSDAIAGVVNFIMTKDFEGVRIDAQYGVAQHHNHNGTAQDVIKNAPFSIPLPPGNVRDGATTDVTVAFGVNAPDGKGNITAYAGYRNVQPVLQSQRDYSACSLASTSSVDPAIYDTRVCAGSSNSAFGRFINPNTRSGGLSVNPNGSRTFVNFSNALRFNYAPQNYFQRPDERYTAGYFAHYDINKMVNLYSDLLFADDHSLAQIASSGLFQGTGANGLSTFGINCNNPLMSTAQAAAICGANAGTPFIQQNTIGFRFAGLPRQDDLRHTNYRISLGSKGELADGWNYDAYLQYGTSIYNEHYNNDVSVSRVQNALLVNPATGQCQIGAGSGCVPLDIFVANGLTPAMLGYVITPGFKSGQTTEQVASVSVNGDLGQYGFKSPWANDGVGVAGGAEYRRETLDLRTDAEFSSGDLSGQGGPTLGNSGSYDVYELFGEARVPILQDQPFAKDLTLELGYRFSDYNTAANTTNTYKVGLNWSPIPDVKVRAGYNRAVRAPNVVELFTPSSVGLYSGVDPCAGGGATLAKCVASGATAAQYAAGIPQCPAAQCTALLGGNINLKAEESDTYTVGLVLQPSFLRGFDMTVDYFNIKVANLISSLPALTVTDCIANSNPTACALFHRDPTTGAIFGNQGYVVATNVNTGYLQTSGIDVNANYRTSFSDLGLGDWGSLALNLVGTYTKEYVTQPTTGGGTFDCAGLFGVVCSSNAQGGPIPKWRHKFRVTWTTPWPVTVSLDWRYIGKVKFDVNQSNVFLADPFGRTDVPDAQIKSYNYIDLSGTWKVRDAITLRAGVNNVFDKDPPFLDSNNFPASGPPFGNGNTYPGTYDALGRTLFVGLTADF
ncbi:MAG: TonB-dependent receptor [Phenylobacterium sp.]|jgi:iron complex outermembrane receptor protein|nr:TonB-dependent receptor [Phenylobacterium sp.]